MPELQHMQRWSECQLVSLWNAARLLGVDEGLIPTPRQKRYRRIAADCGCLFGACVTVEPELERLGLRLVPGSWSVRWIMKNLPVELGLFCHRGFHSVLAVAFRSPIGPSPDNWELQLANYARGRLQWVGWSRIKKMSRPGRKKPQAVERR
jgi:hypothetical protein